MRKHSGWFKNYLLFAQRPLPYDTTSDVVNTSAILANKSLNTKIVSQLRSLDLQHQRFSLQQALRYSATLSMKYAEAMYPAKLGMPIYFNLNLIRSLALRLFKVKRMLWGYPIRGQRRWSNANTAKRCCMFFKQGVAAYERELWGYLQPRKTRSLTKLDEARFGSQHRVIHKRRFVTKKIKSRKELVLRRKKRKKTPWR